MVGMAGVGYLNHEPLHLTLLQTLSGPAWLSWRYVRAAHVLRSDGERGDNVVILVP